MLDSLKPLNVCQFNCLLDPSPPIPHLSPPTQFTVHHQLADRMSDVNVSLSNTDDPKNPLGI